VPFLGSFLGHAKNERPAASIKLLIKTKLQIIQYFYAQTLTRFNREIDAFLRAIRTGSDASLSQELTFLTIPFSPVIPVKTGIKR